MSESHPQKHIEITYRFQFNNNTEKVFVIKLDGQSLNIILEPDTPKPSWTKLKYEQCENCPLKDNVEYCPVAVNLASLVDSFKDFISYEQTIVTVQTRERTYVRETTLQKGLSAIIGIYMVTNECPIMNKLNPMVRFHLPFATPTETIYRAVSMYLTAQFFRMKKGLQPDWELGQLADLYKAISKVNRGISRRVSSASNKDANVNAVVILHSLGETMPFVIESNLSDLEFMFNPYLQ